VQLPHRAIGLRGIAEGDLLEDESVESGKDRAIQVEAIAQARLASSRRCGCLVYSPSGQLCRLPRDPDANRPNRADPDAARGELLRHQGRADAELKVDSSGGSTILVWPRDLDASQRARVFAYARRQGFAIIRGGAASELTTAKLLIRLKGALKTYDGAYAPDANRTGVPCYFGTVQNPAKLASPGLR
jgi:hypothetical protein